MIDKQQIQTIKFKNGCTIEMVLKKRVWLGLGRIMSGKTLLRDGSRPIFLRIDTPEGILYTSYALGNIDVSKTGRSTVTLKAIGCPWGRREYLDEYDQQQYSIMEHAQTVTDEVKLEFSPAQENIGGRTCTGPSAS